jgi:hypothetical protein
MAGVGVCVDSAPNGAKRRSYATVGSAAHHQLGLGLGLALPTVVLVAEMPHGYQPLKLKGFLGELQTSVFPAETTSTFKGF